MAKEIERKFLISESIPWELGLQKLIKQGYIFVSENKQLRIRIIDNKALICLKYTKNIVRDEYEYEIPLLDGFEILHKCKVKLEKVRNTVTPIDHSYSVDFDTYPNGLMVAEVEFKTEEAAIKFIGPDWFGEEITGKKEYSNITLAKDKLNHSF